MDIRTIQIVPSSVTMPDGSVIGIKIWWDIAAKQAVKVEYTDGENS